MNEQEAVQPGDLFGTGQIRLAELSVYNWGSFHGLHTALINAHGTLITGDNGAGKSTLIDGLMALLLPPSKASFNIAAAQGDRTDRTLMSYIRGNYGKLHDGNETASLLKRPGATASALRACYKGDDGCEIVLATLFWTTQATNAADNLKRLFIIGKRNVTLEEILHQFGEGDVRTLKQHVGEAQGLEWFATFTEYQEAFTRLLRMENRNAPALLSRALGLKKIDDLTGLIRDLVLEPSSVREHASLAVREFDDLVGIHHELSEARRQRDALARLPQISNALVEARLHLIALTRESVALPIYFAEQCHRLWSIRLADLEAKLALLTAHQGALDSRLLEANERVEMLYHAYQSQGGERLEGLRRDVQQARQRFGDTQRNAVHYQETLRALGQADALGEDAFQQHRAKAQAFVSDYPAQREASQNTFADAASQVATAREQARLLATHIAELKARPNSNIDPVYQMLRDDLAGSLQLEATRLPFVGELLDVRAEHAPWRGAIERALGGLRTTLLVDVEHFRLVTRWLNSRHTGLHVRVQVVGQAGTAAPFKPDGYLRKLEWSAHPYRDWLKHHLARFDLHCLDNTQQLDDTPFSMTIQGLVHLDKGRFEKKDQQAIDNPRNWCLGFNNRARLQALEADEAELQAQLRTLNQQVAGARAAMDALAETNARWETIAATPWASVDVWSIQQRMETLAADLQVLEDPQSDLGQAKARWQASKDERDALHAEKTSTGNEIGGLRSQCSDAGRQLLNLSSIVQAGITDDVRDVLTQRIGSLPMASLDDAARLEREQRIALDKAKEKTAASELTASNEASCIVATFKSQWPLVSNDWVSGTEGLGEYLEYLSHLENEGLPELVERFQERLNRNATQSLAQIRQAIDAEREDIRDRIDTINNVLERTEFRQGSHLRLGSRSEIFDHVKLFNQQLSSVLARAGSDDHDARFRQLQELIVTLQKATQPATSGTMESLRLLDSRYQLSFFAEEIDKSNGAIRDVLDSSSGKSGGEKESFAGTIVAASLAYVLTPDGCQQPIYCTVFLDEAFSNTAEAVSRRVLKVFKELRIHVNLITPYKNLNLARESARSLLIAERDPLNHESRLCEMTWEEIDQQQAQYQVAKAQADAAALGIETELTE
ncbi:AAA family ATPase [Pseudomonas silvicola]|nr:AAA family ATPase [Pseudomonas silvicola]